MSETDSHFNKIYNPDDVSNHLSEAPVDFMFGILNPMNRRVSMIALMAKRVLEHPEVTKLDWSDKAKLKDVMEGIVKEAENVNRIIYTMAAYRHAYKKLEEEKNSNDT